MTEVKAQAWSTHRLLSWAATIIALIALTTGVIATAPPSAQVGANITIVSAATAAPMASVKPKAIRLTAVFAAVIDALTAERVTTKRITAPAFPSTTDVARAMAYLRARNADAAVAVVDSHGQLHGYGLNRQFTSASVVKAMLLVAYLRTHATISTNMRDTLTLMIIQSNNAAAYRVYAIVGAQGLQHLARLAGMKHFKAGRDVLYSRITAADQARYFYAMDCYIPKEQRSFARYLLSHITAAQSWGVVQVAQQSWRVFFKSGWFGPGADPFRLVNQVARFERGQRKWSLAVLSEHNPASPYAFVTLRGVDNATVGTLARLRPADTPTPFA